MANHFLKDLYLPLKALLLLYFSLNETTYLLELLAGCPAEFNKSGVRSVLLIPESNRCRVTLLHDRCTSIQASGTP